MVSVCCCSINSKWEVETLYRTLKAMNPQTKFEFIVTLDDRMEDGSLQLFKNLTKEDRQFKFVRHTEEDTIQYMSKALRYYKRRKLFSSSLIDEMQANLQRYAAGELFDRSKGFLWQSSGVLYNRAVAEATGDVIIVTPGDFIYLFSLDEIEQYVISHTDKSGDFYASLPAIWARVTNMDKEWLQKHVKQVHDGHLKCSPHRWDSREIFRDYLRYPPKVEDFVVPNFYTAQLISLDSPKATRKLNKLCDNAAGGGMRYNPQFHGFHVMTRSTFRRIGGFTEEWIHRAFPDDKMTRLGNQHNGQNLPPKFSVAWCGVGELLPGHGPGYSSGWQKMLPQIDEYYGKHPIPPNGKKFYLYGGVARQELINIKLVDVFDLNSPPQHIFTGKP